MIKRNSNSEVYKISIECFDFNDFFSSRSKKGIITNSTLVKNSYIKIYQNRTSTTTGH